MQCNQVIPSDLAGVLLYAFVCRGVSQEKTDVCEVVFACWLGPPSGRLWHPSDAKVLELVSSRFSARVLTACFGVSV